MRWKTTLVLLLATIGIGAYVSLYEIRQPSPEEQQRISKYVLNISTESVTQLALDLPQAKVTLTRSGSQWRVAPNNLRADPTLISSILNQFAPLVAQRILNNSSGHSLNPKEFGLDPAIGWMTIVSKDNPTTLLIGEKTPVKNNRYVKISSRPEIFVVSSRLFDVANQPTEKFRDSLLLRFDTWLADSLSVISPSANWSLTRSDKEWRLVRPMNDRADRNEVNSILSHLAGLTIKRVVNENPQFEQLSSWGFDHPKAEIKLLQQHHDPVISVTLFFGKPLSDNTSLIYAKRNDEPPLYAVSAADVEALLKDPQGLRARGCFEYFTSNVTKIEVVGGTTNWMIERTEAQWRQKGSNSVLETDRVEEFLSKLSDIRISGFVEEVPTDLARYGLQPPPATITVWVTDHPKPQRLLVGTTVPGSNGRYGRVEGRSAILRLPDIITELLKTTPDRFSPTPAPTSASSPRTTSQPQPK